MPGIYVDAGDLNSGPLLLVLYLPIKQSFKSNYASLLLLQRVLCIYFTVWYFFTMIMGSLTVVFSTAFCTLGKAWHAEL